nr:hypothetical protein 3 [bacterium]
MATFFDTGNLQHLNLLHSEIRDHTELDNVVDSVEYNVLDYYKQRPSIPLTLETGRENLDTVNEIQVRLIDYNQNNPENSESDLQEALRRTIADVVSWVLRNYDNSQGVQSIQQGKRSITFIGPAPSWDTWPDGWNFRLRNFDDREAIYSI